MPLVPNLLVFVVYLNWELLISPSTSSLVAYRSVWITFQSIVLNSDPQAFFILFISVSECLLFCSFCRTSFQGNCLQAKDPRQRSTALCGMCNLLDNSYTSAESLNKPLNLLCIHKCAKMPAGHAYFRFYILKGLLQISLPISLTVAVEQINFEIIELIVVTFAL